MTTHKRHLELLDERLSKLVHRLIFAKPEEAAVTKDELDVLKEVKSTINSMVSYPPHVLLAQVDNKWWMRFRNGKRDLRDAVSFSDQLCAVDHPVIDHAEGSDHSRLVLQISNEMGKELREVFEIPIQPAPLDATESLVRAAHGLNGAAIEFAGAAREIKGVLAELRKR